MKKIPKIHNILESFKGNGIRQKVLRIAMSGSLLFAGVLGSVFLFGTLVIEKMVSERGEDLREEQVKLVEKFNEASMEKSLLQTAALRRDIVEASLAQIKDKVYIVAKGAEIILDNQSQYNPRPLPNTRGNLVYLEKAYMYYNKELANYTPPEVQAEWYKMNNIEDFFLAAMHDYTDNHGDITLVSDKGYVISMDFNPNGEPLMFDDAFLDDYDPVNNAKWFKGVKTTGKLSFSELGVGSDGGFYIHMGAPYYHNGVFAGGVGVGIDVTNLYNELMDTSDDEDMKIIVLNNDGQIIMSSETEGTLKVSTDDLRLVGNDLSEAVNRMISGETGVVRANVDGATYFLAYTPIKSMNWFYGILKEESYVKESAESARADMLKRSEEFQNSVRHIFVTLILIGLALFALTAYFMLKRAHKAADNFVDPIEGLVEGVEKIASGNFSHKLPLNLNNELDKLAEAVNGMGERLEEYMKSQAEKERINAELSLATDIQSGVLPHEFPPFPGRNDFDLFASTTPAREVGGDFYDFYLIDENHLSVTIADVSGKGVGAALFMLISRTMLKQSILESKGEDLADIVNRVNNHLNSENPTLMFVTAFIGVLDLRSGVLSFVNCGHNPPIIYQKSTGGSRYLDVKKNCPLAIMEDVGYEKDEIILSSGDALFLYTDGVTEAMNEDNEQYGEDRLLKRLKPGLTSKDMIKDVEDSIIAYRKNAMQSDDITMLALKACW